jgi:hypothetical protein
LTTSYSPGPTTERRRRGGIVAPLVLIFIGVVFLLENTGYLPPNFWVNLWRLWPVLLVLAGIELLLANRIPRLVLAGLAVAVLIVGAVVVNSNLATPAAANTTTQVQNVDLGGATQAAVTVRFGAGQLNIGPLPQPAVNQLASMTYSGPPDLAPRPTYSATGGIGQLDYSPSGRRGSPSFPPFFGGRADGSRMDLSLAPSVPITSLTIQTGATQGHLDLSGLRVSSIDMSVGAATTWMRLPESAGLTSVHISGGASNLTLEVPQGVAARIQHRGGLSTLNVDQSRFPLVSDGVYQSPDYDTATNKADVSIETGVTTIQVS